MTVSGTDLIAMFETQIGHPYSGDYDTLNGNHAWAYFCEAGVESTGRQCGLTITPQGSATGAGLIAAVGGILQQSPPEHGGVIVFGPSFYYPWGHTGYWNADRQQLLGTLTDGTGVGYKNWGPWTAGYAGWYALPGSTPGYHGAAPEPLPPAEIRVQDNPYESDGNAIIIGGGFFRLWQSLAPDPLVVLGYPMRNEQQAVVRDAGGLEQDRTVQYFERGILLYQAENAYPWDCVVALRSQTITPL